MIAIIVTMRMAIITTTIAIVEHATQVKREGEEQEILKKILSFE